MPDLHVCPAAFRILDAVGIGCQSDSSLLLRQSEVDTPDPLVSFVWQHWEPARSLIGGQDDDDSSDDDLAEKEVVPPEQRANNE